MKNTDGYGKSSQRFKAAEKRRKKEEFQAAQDLDEAAEHVLGLNVESFQQIPRHIGYFAVIETAFSCAVHRFLGDDLEIAQEAGLLSHI